jgi:hypothetical protein
MPHARLRDTPAVWVAAAIAAVVVVGLACRVFGGPAGLWASASNLWASDQTRVYPRDEFQRRVTGLTERQVVDAVGPPTFTASSCFSEALHYERRTRDERTGRVDAVIVVHVRQNKVVAVAADGELVALSKPSSPMAGK